MDVVTLIVGLVLLVGAGDLLVKGAVALSLRMAIPAIIISATVVALGTSAPELLISVEAAIKGAPGIALGNVVGSNIANVLLVLGVPALLAPLAPCGPDAHRNLWFMLGATAVFTGLMLGGTLFWWGGLILVMIALAMIWDSLRIGLRAAASGAVEPDPDIDEAAGAMAGWKIAGLILAGVIGLPLGADLLISGARGIATSLGVSEAVIALTLVAIGTSLPELATTCMAALRGQTAVAIGNVVGSNIFNITAVIGTAALFAPIGVPDEIAGRDLWVMIGAAALLTPLILLHRTICRITGGVFLCLYGIYLYIAFA
ncbi:MAG: calcium/sodium antiporter [Pseudomonadota bacterium]